MKHSKKKRHSAMRDGPNPIDVHVGCRVRHRRTLLGMSQEMLGEAIGVTFQQVQKYERGTNRIAVSRLYDLCNALDLQPAYFFEELPEDVAERSRRRLVHSNVLPAVHEKDHMAKRETLELVRAYYRISDPKIRTRVYNLVKALAACKSH